MIGRTAEVDGRLITADDLELRARWLNEPSIRSGIAIEDEVTVDSTKRWFERIRDSRERFDFVFVTPNDQVPIGMGGLVNVSERDRNAELYVFIAPKVQGKGFGYSSTRWLCQHAFSDLQLERVYLWMFSSNRAALRLYEKVGFVHEGTLRRHRFRNGEFEDRLVLGILRSEWLNGCA